MWQQAAVASKLEQQLRRTATRKKTGATTNLGWSFEKVGVQLFVLELR